jgi:proteic killer suppression protein
MPVSKERAAEIAAIPDHAIDTSDVPEASAALFRAARLIFPEDRKGPADDAARHEWQVAGIEQAASLDRGKGVPHARVKKWVNSWESKKEPSAPKRPKALSHSVGGSDHRSRLASSMYFPRSCRNIPSDLESRLFRKLQMIDDAMTDQYLPVPPSNRFEKLRGDLAGFHAIRVNKQWQLVFRWDSRRGEATGVYLDDQVRVTRGDPC